MKVVRILTLTLLVFTACAEKHTISPETVFVEPGNFTYEGFLDVDTYQFVGIKIGKIKGKYYPPNSKKAKTFQLYQRNAGKEYSLFLARISAYKKLSSKGLNLNDPDYVYLHIPEKVNIAPYMDRYSDRIPPISHRLGLHWQTYDVQEEIIEQSQMDDIIYRTVIHIKAPNLYYRFAELPRRLVIAKDPSLDVAPGEFNK